MPSASDSRQPYRLSFLHLIEAVHPGRRLLRNALPLRRKTVPFHTVLGQTPAQRLHDNRLFMRGGFAVERRGIALGRESLMNQQRRIAAVIHDKMGTCTARKGQRHGRAPPILFEALPLPCEDGNAPLGDGRRGMVLRGEDVAATPAHIGTELDQRLNQHRGLYGHVERTCAGRPSAPASPSPLSLSLSCPNRPVTYQPPDRVSTYPRTFYLCFLIFLIYAYHLIKYTHNNVLIIQ